MSVRRIINAFDDWLDAGRAMVLVTVYETLGSTYSKAGHRMLIADNGDFQGLVSGGCLEGDLAERANRVIEANEAVTVTYDLRDEADDLWGLGVGCNGLIRVLLQPVLPEAGFEPFATLRELWFRRERVDVVTVIAGGDAGDAAGTTIVCKPRSAPAPTGGAAISEELRRCCQQAAAGGAAARYETRASGLCVLVARLEPIPRLLVLGAGLDAVPLVRMAAELGWHITVADHRPAYLRRGDFATADEILEIDPRRLGATMALSGFDAVLVMSHHLLTDEAYLRQLAGVELRYLGVLGPRARRERLLGRLGDAAGSLEQRLRGPVGLDIGGDSPETIALSILAELQTVLAGKQAAIAAQ